MNFRKILPLSLLALALFTPGAGALNVQRHSHTSTLLPNGDILIAGGAVNQATATDSVEMYDMASNAYTNWAGGLVTERSSHTATLMSDGRVLIAGGFGTTGLALATLEICDPISKTCAAAGVSMATARGGHTATLLSVGQRAGQVLLCGGRTTGGATVITETCETFSPSGPAISAAGSMVSPREGHAALLLHSGKVFVTGGRRRDLANSAWIYEPMNEMFDPAANAGAGTWGPVAALLQGRVNHTATVLNNGKIMVAGGYNATNSLYCQAEDANSLKDDCWNIKFDPLNTLDSGTHGYIDGAEFFDQNGARVVLSEETYGEIPYRVSGHTAALEPDGRWRTHGGYGNIVPTFFTNTPALTSDSVIYLTPTGNHTATIDNTSLIRFPLMFSLSRPVSGRLVDADVFISGPVKAGDPSITLDTAKIYLGTGTAPADASPVGLLLGEGFLPGDFNDVLRLLTPSGTASFEKATVTSGETPATNIVTSALTMASPLYPAETEKPISGSAEAWVSFALPDTYRKVTGVANVISGTILDGAEVFSITLNKAGSGTFDVPAPTFCDTENKTCLFITTINFTSLTGLISNLTTLEDGTTVYSPLNAAGDKITLSLELDYGAGEIRILDRAPTYSFDRSTMVVRGMVFSTELTYAPDINTWGDLTDKNESPAINTPSFNHTALLTPAADTVIMGGRNCEFSPDTDCLRSAMRFSTAAITTVGVPVYKSPTGCSTWPAGEKLKSKRAFHTSTPLPDGGILTCGGSDGTRLLATCELMDPLTKKWSVTGSMTTPRSNHTATLLPNGNVLAAGGVTLAGAVINTAEIYYPDTKRWVATSPMHYPRQLHTATLMPDGNVLVAGGVTTSTYTDTAETYISSSAYWEDTGPMVGGRSQHTATLLKSGNVLVAGGINGLGAMKQTETYNYLTRAFTAATNLNTARYAHTANQLRDGNVIVAGGSDNTDSLRSCEIYAGGSWTATASLNHNRANHRSALLPNGKLMVTGGEMRGTAQSIPEGFTPDYRSWSAQGSATGRTHHTSVITRDNMLVVIGGWSGGVYLDTTETIHFNFYPDMNGLEAETIRQPSISSGTVQFNNGDRATLLSDTSNFHGITEASGGGAGAANSSFHNPRVYMQQIDNPSGFMVDLSTRIYSWYGGPNAAWDKTLSSITVITPDLPGVMPHGWYHMRAAAAGVFSDGHTVQVTVPRPTGAPSNPTGSVLGASSITWTWTQGTIPVNGADGYNLYSSSDNVFIATMAFVSPASYTQTNLVPNTLISVKVGAYNLGGSGPLAQSSTYYTLASVPTALTVTDASFTTAKLEWASDNSPATPFEVSMCAGSDFANPVLISTPVPFNLNYTSTSTTIDRLLTNTRYYFRVRARNGEGITTQFSNRPSTLTVADVGTLTGTATSSSTINWSWNSAVGADFYEIYDVTAGTVSPVRVASTTYTDFTQSGLGANHRYAAAARAVKNDPAPVYGPMSAPAVLYTLAGAPSPDPVNIFTNVSTGGFTANWLPNDNSTWTIYGLTISTDSLYLGEGAAYDTTTEDNMNFAGLKANNRYFVKVAAINGDGVATVAVSLGSKYTLARAPASVTPATVAISGVTLTWSQNDNTAGTVYEVRSTTVGFPGGIATPLPFSDGYTGNSHTLTGLLTSTTYYFDVAARNGDGVLTSRAQAVPAAYTEGTVYNFPPGSIAGITDPAAQTTITGTLPNNRTVTLTIPAGAFPAATAIAISSSVTSGCGNYLVDNRTVGVEIFTENGAQPQVPVALTLSYNGVIPSGDEKSLVLARDTSLYCLPLETRIDTGPQTLTATLNHFSSFKLMLKAAASNLSDVRVYPNPFRTNRGNGYVTIDNIPASAKLRIYTLAGTKVWEGTAGTTGIIIWRGVNAAGNLVASGVYLAVVDSSAGKKVLKLAVER